MDISSKQLRRQKTETNLAKMDQKSCSKLKKKKESVQRHVHIEMYKSFEK